MSKKTTVLTIVIAAVLLLVVVVIALNAPNRQTADQTTETTQQTPATETGNTAADDQQVAATITYTDSGFDPSNLTVKAGDTVRVENKSSMPLSFNSGDHPTHTKDSDLNVGDVPQGGSRTFTVTKKGTWSFHNHENASDTGTIVVE